MREYLLITPPASRARPRHAPWPLPAHLAARLEAITGRIRLERSEPPRYYELVWEEDLLGDWTLVRVWGGIGSRRGRTAIEGFDTRAAVIARAQAITRRRLRHQYHPV